MSTQALKAVATNTPPSATRDPVVNALVAAQSKMKSVLPAHITPEKMARLALTELRLNATLRSAAQANPESFVSSVMLASQLGLEIGGAKGHGYLVPYGREVKFMPGYRGLISLARQSGQVTSISVHIVYEKDSFDLLLGVDETIKHKPFLDGERGKPKFVYGVARFTDGSHHFDWMTIDQVERIRKLSKQGNSGPWKDHYDEMVRKTMVRRLAKYLPMSSDRLEHAVAVSDAADNGKDVFEGAFVDLGEAPADVTPPADLPEAGAPADPFVADLEAAEAAQRGTDNT